MEGGKQWKGRREAPDAVTTLARCNKQAIPSTRATDLLTPLV